MVVYPDFHPANGYKMLQIQICKYPTAKIHIYLIFLHVSVFKSVNILQLKYISDFFTCINFQICKYPTAKLHMSDFFTCIHFFVFVFFRLDGKHVVFGKVIEGTDVVNKMEAVGSGTGQPSKEVLISDCGTC